MTLLAGTLYDPGTIVTKATSAGLAMTALDTTNLRLGFTVPANGAVLTRLRCVTDGATTAPWVLLGVLEGSTVRGRVMAFGNPLGGSLATTRTGREALFVVPGLTPAASLTWDAAYGVESAVASSSIRYGGPNDTTTNNANGGFSFEIYDCPGLLGAVLYDPSTLATKVTTANLAMTAFDTTNARITFTAPATGNVLVRIRCFTTTIGAFPQILLGVLDGSTVKGRAATVGYVTTAQGHHDATFIVTGLTPSSSYTWDAAYGVEILVATTNISYGGPNDTTTGNAFGALQYEIWAI